MLAEWPPWGVTVEDRAAPTTVAPVENGTELWPYTSRRTTFGSRTLGINMVFFGDPADVRTALTRRSELEWEQEQIHESDADGETVSDERVSVNPGAENLTDVVAWSRAEGSTRYTYVRIDGQGRWVDESYQLHAGTNFGSRRHIRAYDDPSDEWTAVQIDSEHWDWFRLRHTVTGVSDAQRDLESEFMGERYVERVVRLPFGNARGDSDGWASGVHLVGTILSLAVVGVTIHTRRAKREATQFLRHRRREIALGGARSVDTGETPPLYVGLAGWGLALLAPLFGYL